MADVKKTEQREQWAPPTADQEFVFEGADKLPGWANKSWVTYSNGPALAVPAGDVYGAAPYTTKTARIGDTVKFTVAKGATPAKFTVIEGEPDPAKGEGTRKPAQQSGASLEDMLKSGVMSPDDLGEDAKGQVAARSPSLKGLIEGKNPAPKKQKAGDVILT